MVITANASAEIVSGPASVLGANAGFQKFSLGFNPSVNASQQLNASQQRVTNNAIYPTNFGMLNNRSMTPNPGFAPSSTASFQSLLGSQQSSQTSPNRSSSYGFLSNGSSTTNSVSNVFGGQSQLPSSGGGIGNSFGLGSNAFSNLYSSNASGKESQKSSGLSNVFDGSSLSNFPGAHQLNRNVSGSGTQSVGPGGNSLASTLASLNLLNLGGIDNSKNMLMNSGSSANDGSGLFGDMFASTPTQQQSTPSTTLSDTEFPSLTAPRNPTSFAMPLSTISSANSTIGQPTFGPMLTTVSGSQQSNSLSSFGLQQTLPQGFSAANILGSKPGDKSEFMINNEEFPALQGTQQMPEPRPGNLPEAISESTKEQQRFVPLSSTPTATSERAVIAPSQKRGIITSPDGLVTNIPSGMIYDQFGMIGLLTMLRAIENDPTIVSLALGHDLTTLGLNLNAPDKNLHQSFGGPWADFPCRPQDVDYAVPQEYLINSSIREKLSPIRLNRYGEDLLFYLFYNCCGEMFQLAAAAELYNRDWRYHKELCVWVTRAPGMCVSEKGPTFERGTYFVFDTTHWRKVAKELLLEYDKLEDKPVPVSGQMTQQSQQAQQQQQSTAGTSSSGLSL